MTRSVLRPHDQWAQWDDATIQKYLDKYQYPTAPGKFSSHRRKKIKFLRNILTQRAKTEQLLGM